MKTDEKTAQAAPVEVSATAVSAGPQPAGVAPGPAPAPAPAPAPEPAPAPAPMFTLACDNSSTVGGVNFFLVFPPPLVLVPSQKQTTYPLVSRGTSQNPADRVVSMTWTIPPAGLLFLAQAPGQPFETAGQWPVTLGQTVTVSWVNEKPEAVSADGGAPGVVSVVFQPGIPPGVAVGLAAGPGACMFGVPPAGTPVAIGLAPQPQLTIRFGTPPGDGGFSDLTAPLSLNATGSGAAIRVGTDNVIRPVT